MDRTFPTSRTEIALRLMEARTSLLPTEALALADEILPNPSKMTDYVKSRFIFRFKDPTTNRWLEVSGLEEAIDCLVAEWKPKDAIDDFRP